MMELSGIQRISHTVLMITGGRPIDEVMRSLRARNAALRNMIIGANERRSAYERSRPDNEHRSAYVRSRSAYECRPDNERRSVYERRSTAMAEMTAAMVCTVGAKAGFGANSAAPCTHWNRCSQPQARNRSSHGAAAAPIIRGNWQQHLPMGALGLQNESPFSGHVAEGLNDCEGRRRRQAAPGAAAAAAVDAQQHQAASCPPLITSTSYDAAEMLDLLLQIQKSRQERKNLPLLLPTASAAPAANATSAINAEATEALPSSGRSPSDFCIDPRCFL